MTVKAEQIKIWLGRARLIYNQRIPYEEALLNLQGACGTGRVKEERDRLRRQENNLHKEIEDYLNAAILSPRQYSILALHYLEYESWNQISQRLQVDRRYALLVHTEAIERLAEQKRISA